jgi:hypothetical protein
MRLSWHRMRFLRPDRNPLRRRWDRFESAIAISLLALLLTGGSILGVAAGRVADGRVRQQVQAERSWHQVTAAIAPRDVRRVAAAASRWSATPARVSWAADGRVRTARVSVPPGAGRHGTVTVWVNGQGRLTGMPAAYPNLRAEVAVFAVSAVLGLACALSVAWAGARRLLDRRRMAAWEAEWRLIGPQWSRRRHC